MSIANFRAAIRALGWSLGLICTFGAHVAYAAPLDLATALNQLPTASFEEKSTLIEGLGLSHPKGARELLQAMLDGHVAVREGD